ncbi:MAG: MFS transporter [Chloroflexota bacterium]
MPDGGLPVREPGYGTLAIITSAIFGFVVVVNVVNPLLLDLSAELGVTLGQAGLLVAATGAPWALGAPFGGFLSDRVGRRPLMVLALGGMGLGSFASAFAQDFTSLLLLRFATGCFGAFGPSSTMAAVGDLFPDRRRGMAMSWFNLGFGLGGIAGVPAAGAIGGLLGWRAAFVATGLLLLGLAVLVRATFPASGKSATSQSVRRTYGAVFGTPTLTYVLLANLFERSIFQGAGVFLPSYLMLSYGLSPVEVAVPMALVAVGTISGNIAGGWLGDRLPRAALFAACQCLAAATGYVMLTATWGLVASTLLGLAFFLVNSSSRPAFLALSSELSREHRGAVLGLLSLANQGGVVVGSALGGVVLGLGGFPLLAVGVATLGLGAAALAVPPAVQARGRMPAAP